MKNPKILGDKGEQLAKEFLLKKNYQILHCNWRFKKLEVDLIAQHSEFLIFVEVKTRTNLDFGLPESFVDKAKQNRLEAAANAYIYRHKYRGQIRFDIVSVILEKNGEYKIFHIEDAFFPY